MADSRPLSPHLSIWKWRVHMATSIFHRVTGNGLALVGVLALAWFLAAAAGSAEGYGSFLAVANGPIGWVVKVGLSWAVFQHMLSGLRHLAMDAGWGYELGVNRMTATGVFAGALVLTALFWGAVLLVGRG
jgi:succinate dehydrogenase / fumarate reductase cytochrome b subunit